MILVLCMVLGVVLSGAIEHWQLPVDPVSYLLELMNVDRVYGLCLRRGSHNALTGQHYRKLVHALVTPIREVFRKSEGVKEFIRDLFVILQSSLPMMVFLCHPVVSGVLQVFLLGALPIGAMGFGSYFLGNSFVTYLFFHFDFAYSVSQGYFVLKFYKV